MIRSYDAVYVKFLDWLLEATAIDAFDFTEWLHANFADIAIDMEDGWTQDDVGVCLREKFVSQKRQNEYPNAEFRYGC